MISFSRFENVFVRFEIDVDVPFEFDFFDLKAIEMILIAMEIESKLPNSIHLTTRTKTKKKMTATKV